MDEFGRPTEDDIAEEAEWREQPPSPPRDIHLAVPPLRPPPSPAPFAHYAPDLLQPLPAEQASVDADKAEEQAVEACCAKCVIM